MSYNGYRNFETWLFMLYFEHDIYELLKEHDEIHYSTVYSTVEYILEEIKDNVDNIEFGYAFVKDLVNAAFAEIDLHEVTETILEQLKEETSHS